MTQSKSTILIVDDDPTGRETLRALLISQEYEIAFATNGTEALEQAAMLIPDLVLLDVMMPGMDGFEVSRRLRADAILSEVPIILVTSLDDHQSRLEGIEAGADDFISKPYNRSELRARVNSITRLNRYRRLLDERARFEWVIEHANDGFLLVSDNDYVNYTNNQARIYLNLPPAWEKRPIEETFLTLVKKRYHCEPEETWNHWFEDLRTPATSDAVSPPRYLVMPETPSSNALWLQVDLVEMPGSNRVGRLVRLQNITQQMERQRHIMTFHTLIAHKLNTPLTGLINSLRLLSEDDIDLPPEEVKEFSTIALESVYRIRDQIREVRKYINNSGLAHSDEICTMPCIQQVVEQIVAELEIQTYHFSLSDALHHCTIMLSRPALELILRELFYNARKFHPQNTPEITITVTPFSEQEISFRVEDNGTTLSPEQLQQVWLPYYQAEKGFSGEVSGMGLGLALVASLVWNVGGRYLMTNRDPEPGIVVELLLPIQKDE